MSSEQRKIDQIFMDLFQNFTLGVHFYTLDDYNNLIFEGANKAADQILNVKNAQFIGKRIEDAFPPLKQTDVPDNYKRIALNGGVWSAEQISYEDFQIKGAFEVFAFQIELKKMATMFFDITERKKLENERNRLIKILEATSDLVSMSTPDKRIVYYNEAFRQFFNFEKFSEYKFDKRIEDVHPKWAYDLIANEGIPYAMKYGSWQGETALLNNEGKILPVSQAIMIHHNIEGKVDFISTIIHDISYLKKAEEEAIKNQKIESIALLAGGIAHDFNNLLTGILGNISLLLTSENHTEEDLVLLKDVEQAALNATQLTKQLLTFSKGGDPVKTSADINILLKENVELCSHGKNHTIKYNFEDNLYGCKVDKGQIGQTIQNLVINAIQAMPDGGNLKIETKNIVLPENNYFHLKAGNYIQVSIRDTGIGIPKENMAKIFDPYFTTKPDGTGLGLSICFSIIKKHHGIIYADSEVNKGTTFTFLLPASNQSNNHQKAEIEPESNISPILKLPNSILILEDEETIIKFLQNISARYSIQIQIMPRGEDAIERYNTQWINDHKVDLVILDLTIRGGLGGLNTLVELKKINPEIKAIVSSGYSTDDVIANYKKYGFKARLIKPFSIEDFLDTIQRVYQENNK
jgi:signal transduction histidine kinase/ActR/RegA family two-component response regulator